MSMSETSKYTRYDYFCISDRWMILDHEYSSFHEGITDDYSYFCRRNRTFVKGKELQAYLDSELRKCSSTLYFKVDVSREDFFVRLDQSAGASKQKHNIKYTFDLLFGNGAER